MGLVVNFKTIQQPTILVTFFQVRLDQLKSDQTSSMTIVLTILSRVQSGLQAQSQSNFFIIATTIVFIIIVINCQLAFKFDHQVLQTEQQLVIFKFSYLAQLYLRGKCIHSNVSQFIYVGSELIIIDWAFMHELDILSPLNLARFFLTQQLIYKSKIEKYNISLDIFVSEISVVQPGNFIYRGK